MALVGHGKWWVGIIDLVGFHPDDVPAEVCASGAGACISVAADCFWRCENGKDGNDICVVVIVGDDGGFGDDFDATL